MQDGWWRSGRLMRFRGQRVTAQDLSAPRRKEAEASERPAPYSQPDDDQIAAGLIDPKADAVVAC